MKGKTLQRTPSTVPLTEDNDRVDGVADNGNVALDDDDLQLPSPLPKLLDRTSSISVDSTKLDEDSEAIGDTPAEFFGVNRVDDGGGGGGEWTSKARIGFGLPLYVRHYFCRVLFWLTVLFALVMLVFFIGAEIQNARAVRAGGTTHLYQTDTVCAMDGVRGDYDGEVRLTTVSDPFEIRSFDSVEEVQSSDNATVAHCGECGQCSNPHDIGIYDETRSTLFESSYNCARKAILGGASATRECLDEEVGFTDGCNECWVDNIMCTLRSCVFVCLWHAMWSDVDPEDAASKQGERQALNRCTRCDEQMCGPGFIGCAGANRRRTGILSEFSRDNENEVCEKVEYEWWKDETIRNQWEKQYQEEQPEIRRLDEHQRQLGNIRSMQ